MANALQVVQIARHVSESIRISKVSKVLGSIQRTIVRLYHFWDAVL